MSTKTTFKRVALVAVAALGLGMVAAVPSYAANTATSAVTLGNATASVAVGSAATTTVAVTATAMVADSDTVKFLIAQTSIPAGSTNSLADWIGWSSFTRSHSWS